MERRLKTGVAYHGNRMLSHAITDMKEIARADMDIVVHMLSHTDWERHDKVMGDIFRASEDVGLEVWVDNWGLGGMPGDKSHFLSYHPEAHMQYGDGQMHPYQVCLNAPAYRQFVKDWIDKVRELGGKTVIWDEPQIPAPHVDANKSNERYSCCTCPECKAIFREKYGKEMPIIMDEEVGNFRRETIYDFFTFVSDYSHSLGMQNVICPIPQLIEGLTSNDGRADHQKLTFDRLCAIPNINNIGTDPYWCQMAAPGASPYQFVYDITKKTVTETDKAKRDHNIWIQAYAIPAGREDEIITACEAAYDAGARTILAWGFHGCESNTYRAENPERTWLYTVEGLKRIKNMERDRILAENRKKYMK